MKNCASKLRGGNRRCLNSMKANMVNFNISIGRQKPRTMRGIANQAACPFCDVAHLQNIIQQRDTMILLKNKYNVLEKADQLVLIETDQCHSDMPEYAPEHMRQLLHFGLEHWLSMINSGEYSTVVFFKNFGPMSGGTLRHPHMQIIGFQDLNPDLMYEAEEFQGLLVTESNGVHVNISEHPRVGFTEINLLLLPSAYPAEAEFAAGKAQLPAPTPLASSVDTLADTLQQTVAFMKSIFPQPDFSYNLFFYLYEGRIHIRFMPRFPTSPLYIGYNIHLNPTNRQQMADKLREYLRQI